MDQSAHNQVESIVRSLEEKGIPAAPVVETIALATSHPEAVSDLAVAVMHRFPQGGTFLDGALSYLPQEQWPELVQAALDTLEAASAKNHAAESVIGYASFQCPSALHPHLDRIFLIRPNAHSNSPHASRASDGSGSRCSIDTMEMALLYTSATKDLP